MLKPKYLWSAALYLFVVTGTAALASVDGVAPFWRAWGIAATLYAGFVGFVVLAIMTLAAWDED